MAKKKDSYAVQFARKGGQARAKALSPERRREISALGAAVREAKKRVASSTKLA